MKVQIAIPRLIFLGIIWVVVLAFNIDNTVTLDKYSTEGETLTYTVLGAKEMASATNYNTTVVKPTVGKSFMGFKEALGFKESRGNYFTVNKHGYLGKYQFGKSTLQLLGVTNPSKFLNTPELQEKAFLAYTQRNKWVLRNDIKRFVGKVINGVKVTESGILAAAHLAGPGNVKKFLRSYGSTNFSDSFGTSVQHYMQKFSGYDTSFIKPDRHAKVDVSNV